MTARRTLYSEVEITVGLLDDLAAQGPGGLITADTNRPRYRVTHARDLDWHEDPVVVYGHGNLTWDLDHWGGDRKWIAEAVTDQARDEITHTINLALTVPLLHKGLRTALHRQGWHLNEIPLDADSPEPGFIRDITDHLVWHADPGFTLKLRSTRFRPPHLAVIAHLHHQGRYLCSFAEEITSAGTPRFVHHLQERIRRHRSTRT
ncbi:hypothetical protein [Nocardiopsis protaetiae]|uniref:hypothetical protein n=1 Tax=Nocardiopsis protaetiae TaxID=3382270 RepID=UPI00387B44CD